MSDPEVLPPGVERLDIQIRSNEQHQVRVDFSRQVAYLILPKEHAVQLAMMLLQHAGAEVRPLGQPPVDKL